MAMLGKGVGGYPMNWGDMLYLAGAALKDAAPASSGDALANAQSMLMQRQLMGVRMGLMSRLAGEVGPQTRSTIGDGVSGVPGVQAPPATVTSPGRISPQTAMMADLLGMPLTSTLKTEELNQPHVQVGPGGQPFNDKDPAALAIHFRNPQAVNNTIVDLNDASNTNRVIPTAPAGGGFMPIYDNQGHVVDWRLPGGTAQAISAAEAAKAAGSEIGKAPYTLTTKDVNGVPTTMTTTQALGLAGGNPGGAPRGAGLDPRVFFQQFIAPHEGGYNPADMNGSPTNFGINQKANPGVDVRSLTPDKAADIFANKYWAQSGAANLPPALAAVHADTYFINPSKAQQFLRQSGGDPTRYMQLRQAWMAQLVKTNPAAAKYAEAWAQRNADLSQLSAQLGGTSQSAPQTPGFHGVNADDAKKVSTYMEDARTAEDVVQKAHQFQQLNTKQATGPGFRPLDVHLLGVGGDFNIFGKLAKQYGTGVPAMENLSMQIATGLRAPGQRLTQAEILKNLQSVPSINNLPKQNDAIVSDYEQRAATKRAYANAAQDWLAQHGSLQGFDEAWAARGAQSGPAPSAPAAAPKAPRIGEIQQGYRFKGGNPADQRNWQRVQ